jgi:regulation of enolase protein 1 (concanavalin A-like superfamily)
MKKRFSFGTILLGLIFSSVNLMAQNMDKMQWFNQPKKWSVENQKLTIFVTPHTDYWRFTHYGFTVDDGPFYYEITGEYKTRFDQMGLMLRIDEKTWIKTGVEFVNDKINISAVVTNEKSDWSVIELPNKPNSIWLKAVRKLDAVEISYSFDDKLYTMMRLAYFPDNKPVMTGMVAASPDGEGFNAIFENFEIKHLPDSRRVKWLENNK